MRILHLSSEATWRGGEQQIAYLIEETQKMGVENHVALREGSAFEEYCIKNDIPYIALPFGSSLSISTIFGIRAYSRKHNIDIIHTHSGKSNTLAVLSGAHPPIIVSRRVDFPIKKSWTSRFKYESSKVKRILCVSHAINRIVSEGLGSNKKVVTIHSGVDYTRFLDVKSSNQLREQYKIEDDETLIGNTSALAPHKDYFTFIDVAENIVKEGIKAKFLIIGSGPLEAKLKDYVSAKKLEQNIIFTGFLTNIPEVLKQLDIFMITSETEGLGTSILDAFSSDLPVVATSAGGIPEMVINEATGLLSPVADIESLASNLKRLISDQNLGKQLAQNAKLKLKEFDKKETARKTLEVYKQVLSEA